MFTGAFPCMDLVICLPHSKFMGNRVHGLYQCTDFSAVFHLPLHGQVITFLLMILTRNLTSLDQVGRQFTKEES